MKVTNASFTRLAYADIVWVLVSEDQQADAAACENGAGGPRAARTGRLRGRGRRASCIRVPCVRLRRWAPSGSEGGTRESIEGGVAV
jgi:hypothetical protein